MNERDTTIANLQRQIKIETIFGRGTLIVAILGVITLIVLTIVEGPLPGMGIPHFIFTALFATWYSHRCLKRARVLKDELEILTG